MKIKIGTWTNDKTGEVKDRYLLFGRVMKSDFRTVGAKGVSKLRLSISPGAGEPLEFVTFWGYDALAYNGIPKFSTMLLEVYEDVHDYNGQTYTDYFPLNVIDVAEKPRQAATAKPRAASAREVPPEDPYAGFTDINGDDLPF